MTTDTKPLSRLRADKNRQKIEKEAEWRAGFEAMSRDPESTDISYAFAAQAEVVLWERGAEDV